MKRKSLLFIFGILVAVSLLEAKEYNIYLARPYDSVERIAKQFLPGHKREYGDHVEEYINDLKYWNPHVKNWASIPKNTEIYIDYPYPPYPAPELSIRNENSDAELITTELEEKHGANDFSANRLKLFSTITASQGNFQDTLISGASEIKSQQNSPITLGAAASYSLDSEGGMLNASIYSSFFKASNISGNTDLATNSVTVPNEWGINLYRQYRISSFDTAFYFGVDYEKFSSFNTIDYIQAAAELAINSNTILLATAGFGQTFSLDNFSLLTKISASKVFSSSSSAGDSNKYLGERYLFFASLHGASKFSYNFLYKKHMLRGPTQLNVNRIGVGISYEIF